MEIKEEVEEREEQQQVDDNDEIKKEEKMATYLESMGTVFRDSLKAELAFYLQKAGIRRIMILNPRPEIDIANEPIKFQILHKRGAAIKIELDWVNRKKADEDFKPMIDALNKYGYSKRVQNDLIITITIILMQFIEENGVLALVTALMDNKHVNEVTELWSISEEGCRSRFINSSSSPRLLHPSAVSSELLFKFGLEWRDPADRDKPERIKNQKRFPTPKSLAEAIDRLVEKKRLIRMSNPFNRPTMYEKTENLTCYYKPNF